MHWSKEELDLLETVYFMYSDYVEKYKTIARNKGLPSRSVRSVKCKVSIHGFPKMKQKKRKNAISFIDQSRQNSPFLSLKDKIKQLI